MAGAKHFSELVAWQLARELRRAVYRITERPARFLQIATASLNETENHLEDGIDLGYWTRDELTEVFVLCRRAGSAIGGLQRYLSTCDPKFDTGRVPDPKHRRPNPRTRTRTRTRTEPEEPMEPEEPEEPEFPK